MAKLIQYVNSHSYVTRVEQEAENFILHAHAVHWRNSQAMIVTNKIQLFVANTEAVQYGKMLIYDCVHKINNIKL